MYTCFMIFFNKEHKAMESDFNHHWALKTVVNMLKSCS
jgi:hypothetical protein